MIMKLFTKTICPTCIWIKSEIQRAGIKVDVLNIDQNDQAKQMVLHAGFLSVPVLEVDGKFTSDAKEIISQIELLSQ